jgi:hypothetical protein
VLLDGEVVAAATQSEVYLSVEFVRSLEDGES